MTRETKVGLIVAGSFLCLVGVVVASRWQRTPEVKETDAQVAQTIAPKGEPESAAKKGPVKGAADQKNNPSEVAPVGLVPPPLAPKERNPFQAPKASSPESEVAHVPVAPALPNLLNPKVKSKAELDAAADAKTLKALADAKARESTNTGVPPIIPGKPLGDAPPPLPVTAATTLPPPLPAATNLELGNDGLAAVAAVAKAPEVTPNPAPNADLFVGPKKEAGMQPLKSAAPPAPAPITTVASQQQFKPLPAPPAEIKTKAAEALIPAPAPIAFKEPTNPNLPAMGSEPKNYPLAPISALPTTTKPGVGSLPQVRSIDLITHVCKPEDPTFEAVSNRYFGSPKYGRALLEYNRGMPTAQDNIRQDNPRLLPGQVVYVPPRDILESKFASLIDSRLISPVSAVSISPPLNSSLPGSAPGASPIGRTPSPVFASKDVTKPYRVVGDGQMLIEIAQQTLGDRGRWSEIYRLNPTLRPEYPVPGGTEIRLPSNATVPN